MDGKKKESDGQILVFLLLSLTVKNCKVMNLAIFNPEPEGSKFSDGFNDEFQKRTWMKIYVKTIQSLQQLLNAANDFLLKKEALHIEQITKICLLIETGLLSLREHLPAEFEPLLASIIETRESIYGCFDSAINS